MKTAWYAILLMAGFSAAGAEELTLAQAVARALAQHPELAAAEAEVQAAEAEAGQSSAWDNPALFFRMEGAPREGDAWRGSERVVGLAQEFSPWGRRGAEANQGRALAEVAQAESQVFRQEMEARVNLVFAETYHAQETLKLRREMEKAALRLTELVESRVTAGDVPRARLHRARLAVGTAQSAVRESEAQAIAASSALGALLGVAGFPEWELVISGVQFPPTGPSPAGTLRNEEATARVQSAAAGVTLASRLRWPALELEAGLRTSPEGESFDVGVRLGVPLWDRGALGVKAARARQAAASHRAESVRRETQARLDSARASQLAAIRVLGTYDQAVIPEAEAALAAAHASFEAGDVDLGEVLQVTREWIDARQGQLDWTRALARAEAELVRLR
jgi:cobalt-zinc-cadmium efflux system outer membrane protein